jgi:CGNR zinc finger
MNARTTKRHRRLALAADLAARLNAVTDDAPAGAALDALDAPDAQARNVRRLAKEKPRMLGIGLDGVPGGYLRSTVTALRPRGRVTLYWHARSRTYRVKVDKSKRGASDRHLLLDNFALVSGLVSRCADASCGRFFAKADGRQKFCSTTCADRARQRRARSRKFSATPAGQAQIARLEAAAARGRERQLQALEISAYMADHMADIRDEQARQELARARHSGWR